MSIAKIICVDDSDTDATILQKVLENAGYAVEIACDGATALEMIHTTSYDLAIVDQVMPGQTGLDLLRMLADIDDKPALIMLTAHNEPDVANDAYELGSNHFIIKDDSKKYLLNIPAAVRQTLLQVCIIKELAEEKKKVERVNLNLMLLNNASQLLTSTQNIKQIGMQFVQTISGVLHVQSSTVWLYPQENEPKELVCAAAYSMGRHIPLRKMTLPLSEGIAGWVAENAQTVMSNDVQKDPRFSTWLDKTFQYSTKKMLAVPLVSRKKVVGVLQIINKQQGDFDKEDCTLAETLAAYAANAIVNAQLMKMLRAQNKELALQNTDLNAYSDSVAHDLKNPITQFLGYADNLRENISNMMPEEIDEHLTAIVEQSQRMSNIIDELLLLARVRISEEVILDNINMNDIVQDVLVQLQCDIEKSEAQIHIPEPLPTSVGYGPWVESVWYNYISNGLHYGGSPPHLTIEAIQKPDGMIRYQVSDNGEGLTENERALLFKPFPKLGYSPQGNGLGLVIVRRIIERLNGTFGAESHAGRGSTFYFTLPSKNLSEI